ncbi:MAG TPA: ectoine utilization protein EutA, partial [Rhodobacteraceae bacterium]|nr:ectoine utilization protein EutA [Paracoccaceae bacterium]
MGLYAGDLTYDPPDKNKKIGVIALSTDVTAERDFARILPMERLGVYVT